MRWMLPLFAVSGCASPVIGSFDVGLGGPEGAVPSDGTPYELVVTGEVTEVGPIDPALFNLREGFEGNIGFSWLDGDGAAWWVGINVGDPYWWTPAPEEARRRPDLTPAALDLAVGAPVTVSLGYPPATGEQDVLVRVDDDEGAALVLARQSHHEDANVLDGLTVSRAGYYAGRNLDCGSKSGYKLRFEADETEKLEAYETADIHVGGVAYEAQALGAQAVDRDETECDGEGWEKMSWALFRSP